MSTIADFNRVDACDKIDAQCIDAYFEMSLDGTKLKIETPWGTEEEDLSDAVKTAETCTTLYLSPEEDPNCLVYEPECGDNICIHGDALSRIISMTRLKDVDQSEPIENGEVYIYQDGAFVPFDLQGFVNETNTKINNLTASINSILAKLTPPEGAPDNVGIVFGNINNYADPDVAVDGTGEITSLDKSHGLYSHSLNDNKYGDEIFG